VSGLPADTGLEGLEWIPKGRLAPLRRLGITTLGDLIRHFPRRYEDRTRFDRFPDQASDSPLCLFGIVRKTSYKRFGPRRIFEVRIENEADGVLGTPLLCRWFNMPWIPKMIVTGDRIVLFGKPRLRSRQVVMEHPDFEVIEDEVERSIHFGRITPVHPAGDGISPRVLRELIHRAVDETDLSTNPLLWPGASAESHVWRSVHFPDDTAAAEAARARLVREEFFGLQLVVCARHAAVCGAGGVVRSGTGTLWKKVAEALPFGLTPSQIEVIGEISADLSVARRMNRLLQGDVGSGKTLVALHAMLQVVESGWQAALMAPTQILAEQHFLQFRRLLDPLGIPVQLRTGTSKEPCSGSALIIGTHALLFEGAAFDRLGLVVIDEQHKFGVLQRSRLIARGDAPDVLVMTATPIPRTITQTLYGDLDVSIIREKPPGRGVVVTAVRDPAKLPDIIAFLKDQLAEGRQAYVVYPLIDESEKLEAKAARVEFERWSERLAPAPVGLVHGRLPPDEKEAVMRRFRAGEIPVLVSTTVIEVGVDVPNACIMIIEDAGRFGLSQIHQLRGRIGRGPKKSYCILLQAAPDDAAKAKLAILEKSSDGFEIAEADLALRGPGDLLGTSQTGLPPLRLGDILRDGDIMTEARQAARALIASDPDLTRPGHAPHRALIEKFLASRPAAEPMA